jgi:predicted small metal-binding protein
MGYLKNDFLGQFHFLFVHIQLGLKYNKIIMSTMLSVSCRDVGVDCDFKGTGETEEELMNSLVDHAIAHHGYTREYVMEPGMQEKIKAQIKRS